MTRYVIELALLPRELLPGKQQGGIRANGYRLKRCLLVLFDSLSPLPVCAGTAQNESFRNGKTV